jgi:vacuolar-type H+-ATPase subunit C/Vma6
LYLGDINARARGLRTHLLSTSDLERLARAPSLPALQRELSSLGLVRADAPASASSLERAIRRHAAGHLRILDRWCNGRRREVLSVLFEDEDRRSIQAILRGAEQGAGSEARLAGLVPTAGLSERALRTLAGQPRAADVVRLLVLWSHPFGVPLIEAVSGKHPSLFAVEIALQRAFAKRAIARARAGGPQLVEYVQQVVDLMNAWSALLHFAESEPEIIELAFIPGGRWLGRDAFEKMMGFETRQEVQTRLARELRGSVLGTAFSADGRDFAAIESSVLAAQLAWQRHSVRLDPSGPAPVIGFAIELRAEVLNLQRIIWGVALQAPSALIEAEMVVP